MLQDNKFRFLTQISNGKQFMEAAPKVGYNFYNLDFSSVKHEMVKVSFCLLHFNCALSNIA